MPLGQRNARNAPGWTRRRRGGAPGRTPRQQREAQEQRQERVETLQHALVAQEAEATDLEQRHIPQAQKTLADYRTKHKEPLERRLGVGGALLLSLPFLAVPIDTTFSRTPMTDLIGVPSGLASWLIPAGVSLLLVFLEFIFGYAWGQARDEFEADTGTRARVQFLLVLGLTVALIMPLFASMAAIDALVPGDWPRNGASVASVLLPLTIHLAIFTTAHGVVGMRDDVAVRSEARDLEQNLDAMQTRVVRLEEEGRHTVMELNAAMHPNA